MSQATAAEIQTINAVLATMLEAIKARGAEGMPNGHLYAIMMEFVNHATYERLISVLVDSGRVSLKNHLLTYIP